MRKLRRLVPRHMRNSSPEKRTKFINDMKRGRKEKAQSSAGGDMQPPIQTVEQEERVIRVYDSMMPRGDLSVYKEVKHLSVMLPSIFDTIGFIQKTERTDWGQLDLWKGKSQLDVFDVRFCDGIAQQPSGLLDCGLFMCAYTEYLSEQKAIPQDFIDVDLHRTRYSALLWDYDVKKVNNGYVSENDDPKYSRKPLDMHDGDDLVDLTSP